MATKLPIIVLIAAKEADRRFYRKLLSLHDAVDIEVYESFQNLKNNCFEKLYCGFVVDLRTLVQSSKIEKNLFATLLNGFPVMRVNRKRDQDAFAGLVHGVDAASSMRGPDLLKYFISEICLKTPPRGIRTDTRKTVYLSALLTACEADPHLLAPKPDEQTLKVTLGNVSEGGAFIISNLAVQKNQYVQIIIPAMSDQTPVGAVVKWHKPWKNQSRYLPGFGVAFTAIKPNQVEELVRLLG